MVTIKDVAKLSGVSVATVSRAINNSGYVHEDTLKKINDAVKELNYKPNETARALYNRKSKIIGLLLPDISNPFFTVVARGVEDAALENGYHIIIGNSDQQMDKEKKYMDTFKMNNCSGFISSALQIDDVNDYISHLDMKHVALDRINEAYYSVEADHYSGGCLQAECLADKGCTKILIIKGNQTYSSFEKRYQGNIEVLNRRKIQFKERVLDSSDINVQLLDEIRYERYDGIICYNDLMAIQVMGLLQNNGLSIPREVQVVGFDDIQISEHFYPALTTIRQPAYLLGKIACEQLIKLLNGEKVEKNIMLDVHLIERNSTRR